MELRGAGCRSSASVYFSYALSVSLVCLFFAKCILSLVSFNYSMFISFRCCRPLAVPLPPLLSRYYILRQRQRAIPVAQKRWSCDKDLHHDACVCSYAALQRRAPWTEPTSRRVLRVLRLIDIHIPFILFKMNHYLPKLVATATGHVIMHRKPRNMYR